MSSGSHHQHQSEIAENGLPRPRTAGHATDNGSAPLSRRAASADTRPPRAPQLWRQPTAIRVLLRDAAQRQEMRATEIERRFDVVREQIDRHKWSWQVGPIRILWPLK